MTADNTLGGSDIVLDGPPIFVEPTTLFQLPFNVVEANDDLQLVAYLKNVGNKTAEGFNVKLIDPEIEGIEVPDVEVTVDPLVPGVSVPCVLPIQTSKLEPGIHPLHLRVSNTERSIDYPIQMPSVRLELGKMTLDAKGRLDVMEVLVHTMDGTLQHIEHFRGAALPSASESSFRYKKGFKGVHRQIDFHNEVTTTAKVVAAIGSGFGLSIAATGAVGVASGVTLASVGSAVKALGWKQGLKLIAPRLIPGAGWIVLGATVCAAVYNAVSKGSLEKGDIHWRGESDCPPDPDETTLEELDEIKILFTNHDLVCDTEESFGLNGPLEVVGEWSYSRVTDQRCLTCSGQIQEKVDWYLSLKNSQAHWKEGELLITTEVLNPDSTPLTGRDSWVRGMVLGEDGSVINSAVMLRDDGCGPDTVGGDGVYTAILPIEEGQTPTKVHLMAQAGKPLNLPLYGSGRVIEVTAAGKKPPEDKPAGGGGKKNAKARRSRSPAP